MKNIRKIFVFILTIALCASLIPAAYAKNENHGGDNKNGKNYVLSADMQTLKTLGLLAGSSKDGLTYEYTHSKPTRIQAFIVYLRLINEEMNLERYNHHDGDDNFDDHHGQSSYVQKGMAFAKAHPEFNWVGSNGRFNPMAHLTAREYAKVMLSALGYEANVDFTWNTVESVAEGLGLNVPEGAFTFEQFATMTVQTLYLPMKGTTVLLIDYLASINPDFAAKVALLGHTTTPDTTKPTVTDVILSAAYTAGPPAVSGKVTVYFSEAMKTETLQNLANYLVDLDGSGSGTGMQLSLMTGAAAVPSADKKSVTLTVPGSTLNGGTAASDGITSITISGLQDLAGNVIETVNPYFVRKAANLAVTSIAAADVNKLQVTFNNPMKTIDPTEFKLYKVDGLTLAATGSNSVIDATGKIVTITLDRSLTAEAKAVSADPTTAKLVIGTSHTKDIFGNTVSEPAAIILPVTGTTPATVAITDKIAPSVASLAKGAAPYTFDVTFTEPVNAVDQATLDSALKITNLSGAAQTAAYAFTLTGETITHFTKLTVTITGAYENKYNIQLLGQGIKDESLNIVKPFAKTTLTVLADSLPVIIARETQDLDKDGYLDAVKLTFNESIKDSSVVAGDFDVAAYDNEAFVPTTNGDTANNNVIYITFSEKSAADTSVKPAIAYVQGSLEDLSGNKLASAGAAATTDKAAPVVMTALPVGTLTAGGTVSSAVLVLSEDLTTENRAAILSAVQTHTTVNDQLPAGDIVTTYVWTTNRQLTVSITANSNGGVNPDSIVLTAASSDLFDAAGSKTAAAQIIK